MSGDSEIVWRSRLYIICGIIVIFCNSICLSIFNSTKEFRKRFLFFTMLSLSDMINGVSLIVCGAGRINLIETKMYYTSITSFECLTNYPWPIILLFGGQLPATFHCLLTIERILAVYYVSWYRARWTWRSRVHLTIIGLSICVLLNIVAFLTSFYDERLRYNRICAVMDAAGIIYGTVHYCWIASAYFVAFLAILGLFSKTRRSKMLSKIEQRKQLSILILSAVSVTLVSIPNMILVADQWNDQGFDILVVGLSYLLYGFQSCFNLPIFYFFRHEFHNRLKELFFFKKIDDQPIFDITRVTATSKVTVF